MQALRNGESCDVLTCCEHIGFERNKLVAIRHALPALLHEVFFPFQNEINTNVKQWHPGQRISDLLGDSAWWFRSAGHPDLLLWMRAYAGTIQLVRDLESSPIGGVSSNKLLVIACPKPLSSICR